MVIGLRENKLLTKMFYQIEIGIDQENKKESLCSAIYDRHRPISLRSLQISVTVFVL